ncbi:thymidine kinase-like protein [Salicola phage SCTP-2]|nr:thymidine kinase-like protein [Salicola phage SCTP-2]
MAKLKYFYSVMNAGKSTHLLQVKHNYETFNSNVLLYNHQSDNRYGSDKISSRLGIEQPCISVNHSSDVYIDIKKKHEFQHLACVLVDEIQFFSYQQVYQLSDVVDYLNIPVITYGIKTNAFGELFEGSKAIIELADNIEEIKQLCFCGSKATMVRRFDTNGDIVKQGEEVVSGAEEKYISLCRKHFKTLENVNSVLKH